MDVTLSEIRMYESFNELSEDVLTLAKEVFPDKTIFINYLSDTKQVTLKVSEENSSVHLNEGHTVDIDKGLCHRTDFKNRKPLIYEDIQNETTLEDFEEMRKETNMQAYLGIPIVFQNNERFGTLCSADSKPTHFDEKSVKMLQKIAKMFSYYLEMERLAYRDSLTGLYNRQYLYKRFEVTQRKEGIIYFLDLDGFKAINDTYGHEVGDNVLVETADKLNAFIGSYKDAFAVRLGGDEFVVNVPFEEDDAFIENEGQRLIFNFQTWQSVEDKRLSASLGIVRYGKQKQLKHILKKADTALYEAKKKGKNTYRFVNET